MGPGPCATQGPPTGYEGRAAAVRPARSASGGPPGDGTATDCRGAGTGAGAAATSARPVAIMLTAETTRMRARVVAPLTIFVGVFSVALDSDGRQHRFRQRSRSMESRIDRKRVQRATTIQMVQAICSGDRLRRARGPLCALRSSHAPPGDRRPSQGSGVGRRGGSDATTSSRPRDATLPRRPRPWSVRDGTVTVASAPGVVQRGQRGRRRISQPAFATRRALSCPERSRTSRWSVAPAGERRMFSRLARL